MGSPKTGIYIIQGEINLVVTAMRRTSRWSSHSHQDDDQDPLLSSFSQLKDVLNNISDLDDLEANTFLSPFLEVIRSEDTTGPITGLALTSVNKFLSYGLVCPGSESTAAAIENIADAVTHARFVGTDPSSDEVVLMKILHVLRTLLLTPAGAQLTNEAVCEIMQSCFRICFETRLSELLRKSAEHTLMDMVQLLFSRLPQFKEDPKWTANMKKLKMRAGGVDPSRVSKKKRSPKPKPKRSQHVPPTPEEPQPLPPDPQPLPSDPDLTPHASETDLQDMYVPDITIATTPVAPGSTVIDITKSFQDRSDKEEAERAAREEALRVQGEVEGSEEPPGEQNISQSARDTGDTTPSAPDPGGHVVLHIPDTEDSLKKSSSETELNSEIDQASCASEVGDDSESVNSAADHSDSAHEEYISSRGVRFTTQQQARDGSSPLIPYGLPCVRELFRFLISLTNPLDRHNTDVMVHMGLSLLTVALESGADYVGSFNSLLYLVKDEMCRSLFLLMQSERLSLFAAAIRVCFLLFEALRSHLKFQLEMYLTKLSEIIVSEGPKVSYEMKEIALESVVQLWRIPGLVTELFINYDCDLYCSNVFEDLTKLLSKNAFPVSGLFTTHLLSLDALLTVVDSIEQHCHSRVLNTTKPDEGTSIRPNGETNWDSYMVESEMNGDTKAVQVPPTTGYCMAQTLLNNKDATESNGKGGRLRDNKRGPQIKPNRQRVSRKIPTLDEIAALKHKKRLLQAGAEQFNIKPSKGIAFLQENNLLSSPLDPVEVAVFLKENSRLDKKMIGEYVSNRKNPQVIEAFVKSFNFEDCRVDEALRMYLETFRLPGEAPVISYLMEHFSEHWHKSNGEPFINVDAAFTLAYAIIMLNVDQHNHNVRKQSIPMTMDQFKKNLKGTNGGKDFDEDMLEEVYNAIRGDEIVMPSEHVGLVRENYLWKVSLRRGASKEGVFLHAPTGSFDHELFSLIWGPTVAALSFVFDKSLDEGIIGKAISGFRKCAMISAHYGVCDVFDNLVISLCKFTTLLSSVESPENIPVSFGNNVKAQLACRTVFGLAHRHGDILREGWKNILDCMLQLFRAKLLPKILTEVEDFVDPTGRVSIIREESPSQRNESGVLSSFYSYFTMSEPTNQKSPSVEEQEATRLAHNCIKDCHLEQLVQESKFLREESLQELVKALIFASQGPDGHNNNSLGTGFDEDAAVFYLELLIKVILQNRDRVTPVWQGVREHLYGLVVGANEHSFLVERAIVGLLRLAIRLLRREEIASQVLTSLRILLLTKPVVIHSMSRQVSSGLHDLLRTNAANIHSAADWYSLFILLEVVGAGCNPPPLRQVGPGVNVSETISDAGAQSDSEMMESAASDTSDRGYTSDSELYDRETQQRLHRSPTDLEVKPVPGNGSWLLVNRDEMVKSSQGKRPSLINQYSIALNEELSTTDIKSLLKSCETLAFLVRDAAHVTPHNFESCVHTIRTFVEASLNGGRPKPTVTKSASLREKKHHRKKKESRMKKSQSSPSHLANVSDDEDGVENTTAALHSLSIQLLDLMHTLHTRAASIFSSWAAEGRSEGGGIDAGTTTLWTKCWCPLLQGIARLCCDARRQVRSQALTYLQRALLVHDLQTLSAVEWEACFNKVLFPLLTQLLENINQQDPSGMEETRMRASTLLCKVFLQHLSPLLSLSTFTALWLTILDFMDKYMHADRSDLLCEAIPESLKNMLLVMDTAGIFQTVDGIESQLWKLTWDRIDTFLPNLKGELFKPRIQDSRKSPEVSEPGQTPEGALPASTNESPTKQGQASENRQQTTTGEDGAKGERPASPLSVADPAPSSTYILHPPRPSARSPAPAQSVPILLNPDIMQGTSIPYISPQNTPERATTVVADNQ